MAKANNKYREEVGFTRTYATIKRIERLTGKSFKWQLLKQYSKDNDLEIKKVSDINYGMVSAYNTLAWKNVYDIDLDKLVKADNAN